MLMNRSLYFFALSLTFALWACNRAAETNGLRVAVAANAQFVMQELADSFLRQAGYPVETVVGSSGKLKAQIEHGAPFDLFVAADTAYPKALIDADAAVDSVQVYAYGALAIWINAPLNINKQLALVVDTGVHKIAIPNPELAPYGQRTVEMLQNVFLWDKVKDKVVFGESIAQTSQYVESGACEMGFVSKSVVMAPQMRGKGDWVELSPSLYRPIPQGMVITRHGREKHPDQSRAFADYLMSEEGQKIFKKHGYRKYQNN